MAAHIARGESRGPGGNSDAARAGAMAEKLGATSTATAPATPRTADSGRLQRHAINTSNPRALSKPNPLVVSALMADETKTIELWPRGYGCAVQRPKLPGQGNDIGAVSR